MIHTTRGTWVQMVPSASSTTMSAIPTDAMVDFWIEIIIYIQIYWWLRSPGTNSAVSAHLVNSDGYEIFSRVDYISCGRKIAGSRKMKLILHGLLDIMVL